MGAARRALLLRGLSSSILQASCGPSACTAASQTQHAQQLLQTACWPAQQPGSKYQVHRDLSHLAEDAAGHHGREQHHLGRAEHKPVSSSRTQRRALSLLACGLAAVGTAGLLGHRSRADAAVPAATCPASPAPSPSGAAAGNKVAGFSTSAVAEAAAGQANKGSGSPRPKPLQAQDVREGTTFQAYDAQGRAVSFQHVIQAMSNTDVVLLGEVHDDPVAHLLELRVWQAALQLSKPSTSSSPTTNSTSNQASSGAAAAAGGAAQGRPAILSLEMFETDTQPVMNEYLAGLVREGDLLRDGRAWPNYGQDYRPLVQEAVAAGAPVVCANAPRRLVSLVGKRGASVLELLPGVSQAFLPPLPYEPASKAYKDKIAEMMAAARASAPTATPGPAAAKAGPSPSSSAPAPSSTRGQSTPKPAAAAAAAAPSAPAAAGGAAAKQGGKDAGSGSGSGGSAEGRQQEEKECPYIGLNLSSNFFDAQNLWDATMAHSISLALSARPRGLRGGPGPLVVHVCGKFHCEGGLGINEHLQRMAPGTRVLTVVFVPASPVTLGPGAWAHEKLGGLADFVVLTDGTLSRSYETMHPV